jgi:hypothetical protein
MLSSFAFAIEDDRRRARARVRARDERGARARGAKTPHGAIPDAGDGSSEARVDIGRRRGGDRRAVKTPFREK